MANKLSDQIKNQLHPYLFALKEGKSINKNFLDYSLMLIQVHNPEIIRSPKSYPEEENLALKD